MILGRIIGSVVSTIHHRIVDHRKLLLAERLDETGAATGRYVIALDAIGAGYGETVLILDEGNGARQVLDDDSAPALGTSHTKDFQASGLVSAPTQEVVPEEESVTVSQGSSMSKQIFSKGGGTEVLQLTPLETPDPAESAPKGELQ